MLFWCGDCTLANVVAIHLNWNIVLSYSAHASETTPCSCELSHKVQSSGCSSPTQGDRKKMVTAQLLDCILTVTIISASLKQKKSVTIAAPGAQFYDEIKALLEYFLSTIVTVEFFVPKHECCD